MGGGDRVTDLSLLVGEVCCMCVCNSVWFWSSYAGRLPRACLVSKESCSLSVPSVFSDQKKWDM